jgi:hypothetical protein
MESSKDILNLLLFDKGLECSNQFIRDLGVCEFVVCNIIEGLDSDEVLGWNKVGYDLPPDELLRVDGHDVIDKGEFTPIATGCQTSQLY